MTSNKDTLIDLFAAVGALVFPAVASQVAVGVNITKILSKIQEERKEISQSVVLAELRHVDSYEKLAQDPKGFVAKAARFHQAALVGSAYKNLRLLARMMLGYKLQAGLVADDFLSFAGLVESLRHDELIVLHAFIVAEQERINDGPNKHIDLIVKVFNSLEGDMPRAEISAIASGLTRTGFVLLEGGLDGGVWKVTPILWRLEKSYQFSEILKEEST